MLALLTESGRPEALATARSLRCISCWVARTKLNGAFANLLHVILCLFLELRLVMCASKAHIISVSTLAKERKNQRLVARVSRNHKKLFERAAAIEGRSVATFVIAHALEAAQQLLRQQEIIRLNAQQSRRFAEALLAPPRPGPEGLRRADKAYRKRAASHSESVR